MEQPATSRALSKEEQTLITRLAVTAGQMMQEHGAESRLIEQAVTRIGTGLGCESIEVAISADAIVLTSLYRGHCITTTRKIRDKGINMQVVCEVLRVCVLVDKQLLSTQDVQIRLTRIKPFHYNRWLVVFLIGLSCASFSHLFGADWPGFAITFVAAACAMFVRQEFAKRHHSVLINFGCSAFVATVVASSAALTGWSRTPDLVMAASVLLLVPGFPLINAVLDLVKGHVNMGIARWSFASLLTLSIAIGIILAMAVTGVWGWL